MQMRERLRHHRGDSRAVVAALQECLSGLSSARTIAIYSALPSEPIVTPLLELLPEHCWVFPRVDGDLLHFHVVSDPATDLQPGSFGIAEPQAQLPTIPIREIDVFICPGLAFDGNGGRLGRGGGFYDRMLAMAREDALKIGVGFGCQVVRDTHAREHDIRMNAILCRG